MNIILLSRLSFKPDWIVNYNWGEQWRIASKREFSQKKCDSDFEGGILKLTKHYDLDLHQPPKNIFCGRYLLFLLSSLFFCANVFPTIIIKTGPE